MDSKGQYIFIDNGHDTMKCAQFSTNIYHDYDYFEIPNLLLPHFKTFGQIQFSKSKLELRVNEIISKGHLNKNWQQIPVLMHQGEIYDLDIFENIWSKVIDSYSTHIDQQNNDSPSSQSSTNLLMSEPSLNAYSRVKQREQITQAAFESLDCSNFAFVSQSSLQLFSIMKYSGIVVDFGADLTQISPVENGYTSVQSSSSFKVTGNVVDSFMLNLLNQGHGLQIPFKPSFLYLIKRDLKEQDCKSQNYELPDRTLLNLNRDSGYDKEVLHTLYFNSEIMNQMQYPRGILSYQTLTKDAPEDNKETLGKKSKSTAGFGVQSTYNNHGESILERKSIVFKIMKNMHNYSIEENVHKNTIETILMTGGSLKLPNLGNLIQHQLEAKCMDEEYSKIGIVQQKEPRSSILQGARIYCTLKHLNSLLISRSEYEEEGTRIVNKKCY